MALHVSVIKCICIFGNIDALKRKTRSAKNNQNILLAFFPEIVCQTTISKTKHIRLNEKYKKD